MKSIFTFFVFVLFSSSSLTAQSCTLGNDADFCTTCSSLINQVTGVIDGVIIVPNNNGVENIPATCDFGSGPVPLILGSLTLDIGTNSNLILASDIGIQAGVSLVSLTGNGTAEIVVDGVPFGVQNNSVPSFLDLENIIENCEANATCNSIGDAVIALPVTLIDWTASPVKENVILNWSSSAETDNDFYLLEHGTDGVHFTEIARLSGLSTGRNGATRHYSFAHARPGNGLHYYRLSQQDFDGTRTLLGLRSVAMNVGTTAFVYPNPVVAGTSFQVTKPAADASTSAELYSMLGQQVARFALSSQGLTSEIVLPAELVPGMYLLRLKSGTTRLLVR